MHNTSWVARHQFYNLFQNLKMSPLRTIDDLPRVPTLPGTFIFWIDEAPPRCLLVGIASPKLEDGLQERLQSLIESMSTKSELHTYLEKDAKLSREYKSDFKKSINRDRFLRDHVYFQYLTITDMKEDELKTFEEFLKESSELNPRYSYNSNSPRGSAK
jgi:hypothetical protein